MSISNEPSQVNWWAAAAPYVVPFTASAVAFVPFYHGFVVKSSQQMGKSIPKFHFLEAFKGGVKAAPTIGVVIGTQIAVQGAVEEFFQKHFQLDKNSFALSCLSSLTVAAISAPALAVFNGQTMGKTMKESLASLSFKQTSAIVTREGTFLFSWRISKLVSDMMKEQFGDSKNVEYASTFVSGAIGSVVNHPADTALTLWQKESHIHSVKQLMKGAPARAISIGGFSVCYSLVSEYLKKS